MADGTLYLILTYYVNRYIFSLPVGTGLMFHRVLRYERLSNRWGRIMISTRGRYAIRVMLDLAEHGNGRYIPLKDIAERQGISKKYLEIIVKDMVSGGLITGTGGRGGGYRLCRAPAEYTIGEILEQVEGTLAPVACLEQGAAPCPRADRCPTLPLWAEFYQLTRGFFHGKRLSDLFLP